MVESVTLTVRLPAETKTNLARLAEMTRRTSSFLAADAIAAFVARELDIVEGIKAGQDDMLNGRVIPHDEVMRQLYERIDTANETH
jgi:predicted transcriptional regulator